MKKNPFNQDGVEICGKPFWIELPTKRKPHGRTGNSCSKPAGHGGLHGWPHRGIEGEEATFQRSGDNFVVKGRTNPEENPPSFKEGDRVVFNATPAARMLYREPNMRLANGHEGTVTKMPVGGGRRAATMPGPRGGLVYVEWDDWGTIGVFAEDLQKQSPQPSEGGRPIYTSTYCNQGHYMDTGRPIGHECRIIPPAALRAERDGDFEKAIEIMNASPKVVVRGRAQKNPGFWNDPENAHSIDGVVIDEPDIVKRLFDWHSGQNDPVYAVASSSNAGRPVTRGLVDKAIANLSGLLRKVKGKDKRDLETLIDDLTPYGT